MEITKMWLTKMRPNKAICEVVDSDDPDRRFKVVIETEMPLIDEDYTPLLHEIEQLAKKVAAHLGVK